MSDKRQPELQHLLLGVMKQAPGICWLPSVTEDGSSRSSLQGCPLSCLCPRGPGTASRAGLRSPAELGIWWQPWGISWALYQVGILLGRGALLAPERTKWPSPSPLPLGAGFLPAPSTSWLHRGERRAERLTQEPLVDPGTPGRPSLSGGHLVPLFKGLGSSCKKGAFHIRTLHKTERLCDSRSPAITLGCV